MAASKSRYHFANTEHETATSQHTTQPRVAGASTPTLHYSHGACPCALGDPPGFMPGDRACLDAPECEYAIVAYGEQPCAISALSEHLGTIDRVAPHRAIGICLVARLLCPTYTKDVVDLLDRIEIAGTDDDCADCPVHFAPVAVADDGGIGTIYTVPLADSAIKLFMETHGVPVVPNRCWQRTLNNALKARPSLRKKLACLRVHSTILHAALCCFDRVYPNHVAKLAVKYGENPVIL